MGIESPINGIWSLDETWPLTTETRREGDDHLRLIKDAIKKTFSSVNAVVDCTDEELNILAGAIISTTELNYLDGITSNIQNQIDDPTIMHTNENNVTTGSFQVSENILYVKRDNATVGTGLIVLQNGTPVPLVYLYTYADNDGTRPNAFGILNASGVAKLILRQNALSVEATALGLYVDDNLLATADSVSTLDTAAAKNANFNDTAITAMGGSGTWDQEWDTGFGTGFAWDVQVKRSSGDSDTITGWAMDSDGYSIPIGAGVIPSSTSAPTAGKIRVQFTYVSGGNKEFVVKLTARELI